MRHSMSSVSGEILQGLLAFPKHQTYISKVREYIDNYLPKPYIKWDPDEFKKRSYEISIMEQLESVLLVNPDMEFWEILDEFIEELRRPYESYDTPPEVFEIVSCGLGVIDAFIFWLECFA